jgi:hypothetical protein
MTTSGLFLRLRPVDGVATTWQGRRAAGSSEEAEMTRLRVFLLLAASGSAIALFVLPASLSAADGKPTKVAVTDD